MLIELEALAWLALAVGGLGLVTTTLAHGCLHWKLWVERGREPLREHTPAISILKPLKGVDDALAENLETFADLDYPDYELLLGVEDPTDPAVRVARDLQLRHPDRSIRLVVRRNHAGLNPKVNNLLNVVAAARHELVLISDSNVAVDSDYLRAIASELRHPRVGLVSNLIAGHGEESIGAVLENVHLSSWVASGVTFATSCAHPVVIGKSMLMRRSDLERLGGLASLRDVLAEDYELGRRYRQAGLRVVLSAHTVRTVNRHWTLERFWARHLRWAQLRRWSAPGAYLVEPMTYPVPWLLAAMLVGGVAELPLLAAKAAAAGIVYKVLIDVLGAWHLRRTAPPVLAVIGIPLKDLAMLVAWCIALVRRDVVWRGNALRIGPGTRLERPRVGTEPSGTV